MAMSIQKRTEGAIGKVPYVMVINKFDLIEDWEIDDSALSEISEKGVSVFKTSAKTGDGVEDVFNTLARKMLEA